MAIFVNGEEVKIPLQQLITEGKAIMARENIPPSKLFNIEMYAASIAVSRYAQAHSEWVEANEDDHMRKIRNETRESAERWREMGKPRSNGS